MEQGGVINRTEMMMNFGLHKVHTKLILYGNMTTFLIEITNMNVYNTVQLDY
jgi:hypothetical protein